MIFSRLFRAKFLSLGIDLFLSGFAKEQIRIRIKIKMKRNFLKLTPLSPALFLIIEVHA